MFLRLFSVFEKRNVFKGLVCLFYGMNQFFFDIETSGLDSSVDVVSCIGFFSPKVGLHVFVGALAVKDADEFLKKFARDAWELVGFNSEFFDLPFLRVHGAREFDRFKHVDLMPPASMHLRPVEWAECVSKGGNAAQSIRVHKDSACMALNIYVPKHSTGQFCALAARRGSDDDITEICRHNAIDLYATFELWREMKKWGWI